MGMSKGVQKACAWCGPIFAVVFFAGMLIGGFLPPFSPHANAQAVADFYRDDTTLVRLGLFVMMVAAGITAPFVAVISVQLKRIEGAQSPMAYLQLVAGAVGVVAILVPVFVFTAAAFRPERAPVVTQALNDIAWLPFIMNIPPAILQCLAIGFAVLGDRRPTPILPRWVGYYNFWVAFLFIPGGLVTFFKTGPMAWNGVIGFWLAAVVFGSWFIVMSVVLLRAIRRSAASDDPRPA